MKTQMIMKRKLGDFEIRQNHKTRMFNANDLIEVGNELRKEDGLSPKVLAHYFVTKEYQELRDVILWETENGLESDIKKATTGKNGGTWVCDLIFLDLAMWISPRFKVQALRWLADGLLITRDESGDSFKTMMSALKQHYPDWMNDTMNYKKVCYKIQEACGVKNVPDKWETASEQQLALRKKIHETITLFAGEKETLPACVTTAISKCVPADLYLPQPEKTVG